MESLVERYSSQTADSGFSARPPQRRQVYIGFAIDMDGADHMTLRADGKVRRPDHPKTAHLQERARSFTGGMQVLFDYFDELKCQHAATWFVNEASFKTTDLYPDIVEKCAMLGEVGLHTHFDSRSLGGGGRYISENRDDWFERGLVVPTKKLNAILAKYNKKKVSTMLADALRGSTFMPLDFEDEHSQKLKKLT